MWVAPALVFGASRLTQYQTASALAYYCPQPPVYLYPIGTSYTLMQDLDYWAQFGCVLPYGVAYFDYYQGTNASVYFMQHSERAWQCGTLVYSWTPQVYNATDNTHQSINVDYGYSCNLQADMNAEWKNLSPSFDMWNYLHF